MAKKNKKETEATVSKQEDIVTETNASQVENGAKEGTTPETAKEDVSVIFTGTEEGVDDKVEGPQEIVDADKAEDNAYNISDDNPQEDNNDKLDESGIIDDKSDNAGDEDEKTEEIHDDNDIEDKPQEANPVEPIKVQEPIHRPTKLDKCFNFSWNGVCYN